MLRIHGSVMQSRNFPGFPDDHGIITDLGVTELSRKIHGTFRGSLSTYRIVLKNWDRIK